jgi:hypothetical protein
MAERVSAEDYKKLQAAIKGLDKKIARIYRKRIKEAAGPIGRLVLEFGAEKMPHRGGLAAYLEGSKVAVSARATGADLWLGSKKKSQISLLNKGLLRHPVWGRGDRTRKQWGWSTQKVPAEAFSEALNHLPPEATHRLNAVMTDIIKELKL